MLVSIVLECLQALQQRRIRLPRTVLVCLSLLVLAGLLYLRGVLFGFGPTRIGGLWGRLLDNTLRKTLFERAEYAHEERFFEVTGYWLPPVLEQGANKVGVQVLLHSWLAKSMMARIRRRTARVEYAEKAVGRAIIQPNMGDWYRPVEWKLYNATDDTAILGTLEFDDEDITEFMMDHFGLLYTTVYAKASVEMRAQLFGVAAVYHYGGIFVTHTIRNTSQLLMAEPKLRDWLSNSSHGHKDEPMLFLQAVNSDRLSVLAATPRHPSLECALKEMLVNGNCIESLFRTLRHNNWDTTCEPQCCPLARLPDSSRDVISKVSPPHDAPGQEEKVPRSRSTVVRIQEATGTEAPVARPKIRCSERLGRCSPGWLCNRCLRTPLKGNLQECWWVCRSCYVSTVCAPRTQPLKTITVNVHIQRSPHGSGKRIPRIIHQTYYDELTTGRYPHLQRLQNSWKASGWEYRFYRDEDCHRYIRENYPQRFVDAFDAIIPGAFKADVFRLLVLFKEGGIYADVDVQLDVDLDSFVTSNLSFFVPRDVPVDYWPGGNYCLWNGLMGAEPGHPILAHAIEDVVTTILNRVDYYDVEGRFCSQSLDAEIWKLRTLPIVILTGPCALGMSVNRALGNDNLLQGFDFVQTWLSGMLDAWGDALILLADRYDMGELRFTDLGRNMVVASSNHDRLAKAAINVDATHESSAQQTHVHYSKTETDIVGEFGTYKDHNITLEQILFKLLPTDRFP